MKESLPQQERSFTRKVIDKAFFGVSLVTLPLSLYTAGTSLLAGEALRTVIASGAAFLDFTQIREHNRSPKEQSWYNPEKILDKIIGHGSNRLRHSPTLKMVAATNY